MENTDNINQTFKKINEKIDIENNQTPISTRAWYFSGGLLLFIIAGFAEIIKIHPAWIMIALFFLIFSTVIAIMFKERGKKLQKLISKENIIAQWTLNDAEKKQFVNHLFKHEKNKNTVILFSISFIAIIVFGIFIAVIDEGKLFMLAVLVGLILFLALFAYGMPYYYKYKNSKGDGNILIGTKYAYINGYFHNWDFPLSGIKKVKIIHKPFYGISLTYYYTDRTLKHSETLEIPAPEHINLAQIVEKLEKMT